MSVDTSAEVPAPRLPRALFLAPETDTYAAPGLRAPRPVWSPGSDQETPPPPAEPSRPVRAARRLRAAPWASVVLAVALIAVEVVIAAESFGGLVEFAHLIGIHGRAAYGVPVTLDGVGLVAAFMALRAELSGESSTMPRLALFVFTGASVAANWWAHRQDSASALYYGGMSLAVALMFALLLRQLRAEDRRRAGLVAARLPKFAGPLWVRYPLLAWRSWSLAVLLGYSTPREAINAAIADKAARAEAKAAAALPAIKLDAEALAALPPRDRLVMAFGAVGAIDVPRALALLDQHDCAPDQSHAYQIRKALTGGEK